MSDQSSEETDFVGRIQEVDQSVWLSSLLGLCLSATFIPLAFHFRIFFFLMVFLSLRISVAEVEFRDFVSILSVVKPSQVIDAWNEIVTR